MRYKGNRIFCSIFIAMLSWQLAAQTIFLESQEAVNNFDSSIQSISGDLVIQGVSFTDAIMDLSSLSELEEIGGNLEIIGNVFLPDISQLSSLTTIGGNLIIQGNTVLLYVEGFGSLTSIGGNMTINTNPTATYVTGFSSLLSVGGNISISDNPSLLYINSLGALETIGENLTISDLPMLIAINAFSQLNHIESHLQIENNAMLHSLTGLSQITSVAGDFLLVGNSSLTDISPFSGLSSIGGTWNVSHNNSLIHLDGFTNVVSVGGDCRIMNNESLIHCCAIKPLLAAPNGIEGDVFISDNPSECSSVEEVFDVCRNLVIAINDPCINASNGSIQVQVVDAPAPFFYQLQNLGNGQIFTGNSPDFLFIIQNLAEGIYSLTVVDDIGAEYSIPEINLINIPGSIFEIIGVTTINSSNGLNNGGINLQFEGGMPPYNVFWSGTMSGSLLAIPETVVTIPDLNHGAYEVAVVDDLGEQQIITVNLLDETVPVFPCTEPMDIVILNDISSSVDAVEYSESKQFFVNFLNAINIGPGDSDSRAAILEWSGEGEQGVQIPMTGNLSEIQVYNDVSRPFSGETYPLGALEYGRNYLASVARPDIEHVIVLSTDANNWQISPALVSLANEYKNEGYKIITIAFDNAYIDPYTRDVLQQVASTDLLAPGAASYAELDQELAEDIANLYLCPLDPGSAANTYFYRDGQLEIIGFEQDIECLFFNTVEINIQITAQEQLAIPAGTPVTFYHNNPAYLGATPILTWQIPCAMPAGSVEIFTVNLPIDNPTSIFAVLNDDQSQSTLLNFPVTSISESTYSNNVSDTTICVDEMPVLQAFMSTTTPVPVCNHLVMYTVNVCNISAFDATDVMVNNVAAAGFELVNYIIDDNNCASQSNINSLDIPAECCATIYYTYDVSTAPMGNYNDQDVELSGPDDQTYLNFDGASTSMEDVMIDGSIDCPSTEINFSQTVNLDETCEDAVLTYTFFIDNQTNALLQGITFSSILSNPSSWVFQPYNQDGVIIEEAILSGNTATFIINEIAANTYASFSMNADAGDWQINGAVSNQATISNLPDLDNTGLTSLSSNIVSTEIFANPEIVLSQNFDCENNTVEVVANVQGGAAIDWSWQTTGDGQFSSNSTATTTYVLGEEDISNAHVSLSVAVDSYCDEINNSINIGSSTSVDITYQLCEGESIVHDNMNLVAGDQATFAYEASNGCDSIVSIMVEQLPSSRDTLIIEDCSGRGMEYDGVFIPPGQEHSFTYATTADCDSVLMVKINDSSLMNSSWVPNVFSPNLDGINDCIRPFLDDDQVIQTYEFSIFNRWGAPVFTTTDPFGCWDGKFKGKTAEVGVYVWFVIARTESCEEEQLMKGDVLLLR